MKLSFVRETPAVINLKADKTTLSRYAWHADQHPHVTCLLGPGKRNVLEDQPADHLHHHGVCYSHGVVNNDLDFYTYRNTRTRCRISVVGEVNTKTEGNVGLLSHESQWLNPDGSQLLVDTRSCRWEILDADELYLDVALDLQPVSVPVTLHPTNESGMPLVRPADWLVAVHGGLLTDSEGRRGEQEMFGKPARWVDETAETNGQLIGLTIFDHPSNPVPAHWFARDYGPLSPNYNYFTGPIELIKGDRLSLKYRIFVHAGPGDPDRLNAECDRFATV